MFFFFFVCVCVRLGDLPVRGLVQPPPGPAEPPQQGHQERGQDRTQLISFLYSYILSPSVTTAGTSRDDRFGFVVGGESQRVKVKKVLKSAFRGV